ncbi:MAG TPA: hypothetical protein VE397_10710 [Stellaceae bacterium]|jgi:hypothetical protein|nr:hypothetical protein [Stellaceae bacterium]
MRKALLIDGRGNLRVASAPEPPRGVVYLSLLPNGAEIAFHGGSVPLPALAKALRLLLSFRPSRVALRLLPEGTQPIRIFGGVWEFARYAERLAYPLAPAARKKGALALTSRLSSL